MTELKRIGWVVCQKTKGRQVKPEAFAWTKRAAKELWSLVEFPAKIIPIYVNKADLMAIKNRCKRCGSK